MAGMPLVHVLMSRVGVEGADSCVGKQAVVDDACRIFLSSSRGAWPLHAKPPQAKVESTAELIYLFLWLCAGGRSGR